MGWFTTYEICFDSNVDWDDDFVRDAFVMGDIDGKVMYLHDHDTPKAIAIVNSGNTVQEVMKVLYELFGQAMKAKHYDTNDYKYTYPVDTQA